MPICVYRQRRAPLLSVLFRHVICRVFSLIYRLLVLSGVVSILTVRPQGAYTGDISASMLTSFGSQWVLAGHSDRRLRHGEHGTFISSQCRLAMDAGLRVILCVGEEKWLLHGYMSVMRQLSHSLSFLKDASDVGHALSMLAIAYEPVWAIGSGRAASVDYIEDIHGRIRDWLVRHYGVAGRSVSILYGGSVSPSNAGEILGLSLVDGALLGGSSLNPSALLQICQIYDKVHDAGA